MKTSQLLKSFLTSSLCAISVMTTAPAAAQGAADYPSRPLRLVVPYPPSGSTDILGRMLSTKLTEYLGHQVLTDNRPGANTIIGAKIVAESKPDGYTLLLGAQATLALNPATYKTLPFDVFKDFAPVAKVSEFTYYLVGRNGLPAKNIPELIAYAKANPGALNYGSPGNGSATHLCFVLLEMITGAKFTHVPYQGSAQVNNDIAGDRLDLNLAGLASIAALVKGNKMRMIALAGNERDPRNPGVPTFQEYGYKDYLVGTWFAVVTRGGTPRPIVLQLNREINRMLKSPDVVGTLSAQGFDLLPGTPEDLGELIRKDITRWSAVAKAANIQFE